MALLENTSPFLAKLDYANSLNAEEKALVDALIEVGEEYIQEYECNRKFEQADYTDEVHDGNGEDSIFVKNPPLNSLTDVDIISSTFDSDSVTTTFAASKFDIEEKTGEIRFKPGTFVVNSDVHYFIKGFQNVKITYNGGFASGDKTLKIVESLVADYVLENFDPNLIEGITDRERIGSYFVAKAKNYFDKLSFSKKKMLSKLKIRRV